MAWDEWEQLKSQAVERQSAQMQLNRATAEEGGGKPDLVVRQDDLGAVGHEAFVLHGDLVDKVDIAGAGINSDKAGSTHQAASALSKCNFTMATS